MLFRHKPKFYWEVLKDAANRFADNSLFTNAAALSYYTIFSLPPILLVTIYTATVFYSKAEIEAAIFGEISNLIGKDSAAQLSNIIDNVGVFEGEWMATVIGVGILLFTSTTVLITMQDTLNKIFEVKVVTEGWKGVLKMVRDRILTFGFVIGFAFILMVSLVVNALIAAFAQRIEYFLGPLSTTLAFITSELLSLAIISVLFAAIFKWLPDARIKWRDTIVGATITAVLFTIGKVGISFYIGTSDTGTMYDAAGGLIVLMVWVFWASIIFFFGACYTYSRIKMSGEKAAPIDYAVKVKNLEVEVKPDGSIPASAIKEIK